jgi:nucleoside-diphosphate-sugar epimerase
MRIFLAGATGVLGRRLVPMLIAAGHTATGTTRSQSKTAALAAAGATPCVVDVYDAAALSEAVARARPEIVIHQLTDLPQSADPEMLAAALPRNARLRREGTANLVAATRSAGARRLIAQSIAFVYAPGLLPHDEADPLDPKASAVAELERLVTRTSGLDGLVLRYGRLYGPGTWAERAEAPGYVHVDAAAHAALQAVTLGSAGIYNIAEDDGAVSIGKARQELSFDPSFRMR